LLSRFPVAACRSEALGFVSDCFGSLTAIRFSLAFLTAAFLFGVFAAFPLKSSSFFAARDRFDTFLEFYAVFIEELFAFATELEYCSEILSYGCLSHLTCSGSSYCGL
jgi:hypothetical protein